MFEKELRAMQPNRYDAIAIGLHWTVAIFILVAFGLGLTVDEFPKDWEDAVVNSHALIGLAILLLSLVRLGWRLFHRPPDLPRDMARAVRAGSKVVHVLLYVLMIAVPAIGIPTLLFRGRGLDLGLFEIASPFARTPEVFRPLTEAHELAAYALVGLAAAHMLAALYHQFIRRDEVLLRMLPGSLTGR
jgi:cytochrome b561